MSKSSSAFWGCASLPVHSKWAAVLVPKIFLVQSFTAVLLQFYHSTPVEVSEMHGKMKFWNYILYVHWVGKLHKYIVKLYLTDRIFHFLLLAALNL